VHDALRVPNAALRFKPEGATEGAAPRGAGGPQGGSATSTTGTAGGGQSGATPERRMAQSGRGPGITGAGGPGGFQRRGGGGGGEGGVRRPGQQIYILDPATKKPKAVWIRPGITDGHFTQVVGGELKPGDDVIVGLATAKVEGPPPPGAQGPMGGRQGGGGRGR
jgi:HlyD family secretion protein